MIRTSVQHRQQVAKLSLRRETIRTLGNAELTAVVGGVDTPCTNTNRFSSCMAEQGSGVVPSK